MNFTLVGSDPRFLYLKRRLEADGHSLSADSGNIIAPPSHQTGIPYYRDSLYVTENAALTAEAVTELVMRRTQEAVAGASMLVVGYGRIGSRVSELLHGMGARVTVAARSPEARATARSRGCLTQDTADISGIYAAVVNTVPHPVLTGDFGGALCLDAASAPGGWADDTPVIRCPGLPGLYAPRAAAGIMAEAIYRVMGGK